MVVVVRIGNRRKNGVQSLVVQVLNRPGVASLDFVLEHLLAHGSLTKQRRT
jgi:hypothetical protein